MNPTSQVLHPYSCLPQHLFNPTNSFTQACGGGGGGGGSLSFLAKCLLAERRSVGRLQRPGGRKELGSCQSNRSDVKPPDASVLVPPPSTLRLIRLQILSWTNMVSSSPCFNCVHTPSVPTLTLNVKGSK